MDRSQVLLSVDCTRTSAIFTCTTIEEGDDNKGKVEHQTLKASLESGYKYLFFTDIKCKLLLYFLYISTLDLNISYFVYIFFFCVFLRNFPMRVITLNLFHLYTISEKIKNKQEIIAQIR